jgi:hypothetical protein
MVRAEIRHMLATVKDPATMQRFINKMDHDTVQDLLTCLLYADEATRQAWYGVYSKTIKGEIIGGV